MDKSLLYDLIGSNLLQVWREEIEQNDLAYYRENEKTLLAELQKELPEQCQETLTAYTLAIVDRLDYLYYCLAIKTLSLGIQIGTELQNGFVDIDELLISHIR